MFRLRALLLATVAVVAMTAAGCTEDTLDPNASKTTLLTNHVWKTSKYTMGGTDVTSSVQQTTSFNADGTYSAVYNSKTENGTWAFNVDETNLEMTEGGSGMVNWEILTLTPTSLKLRGKILGIDAEYEGVPN